MYSLSSSEVRIGCGVNSWKGAEQLWSKSTQNKQIKISGAAAGDCSGIRLFFFFFFFFLLLFSQMVEGRRLFNRRRSGSCRLHRPLVALLLSWTEDNSHVVSVKERKEGIDFLFPVWCQKEISLLCSARRRGPSYPPQLILIDSKIFPPLEGDTVK